MTQTKNSALSAEQVSAYLRAHPDFFIDHEELLADINLPHCAGDAVSLIKRQVSLLRERDMELRHRLAELVAVARDNDDLFSKTKSLVLDIIAAQSLDELVDAVQLALKQEFKADVSALTLFAEEYKKAPAQARVVPLREAREAINGILTSSRAVCGALRPAEMAFLFPELADNRIGSAAVAPLGNGDVVGVLAVGSFDPNHYRANTGTLFLTYVSDILNVVLPRLLPGR
jgi:uncharacterized protein YigA (DUF484 family)